MDNYKTTAKTKTIVETTYYDAVGNSYPTEFLAIAGAITHFHVHYDGLVDLSEVMQDMSAMKALHEYYIKEISK